MEYRIVSIVDNNGMPRTDGRYPLRIGRICATICKENYSDQLKDVFDWRHN